MLIANHLFKTYEHQPVIQDVSLRIQTGEMVAIVGPSGAGKTTLLQLLSTLVQPDQGEVLLNGVTTTQLKGKALACFRNQKMGFVFQFHNLLPELTLFENVCLPGYIGNGSNVQADATQWMSRLGLASCHHQFPQESSGGERQRTAIARAMMNQPEVIFADEPTGSLDQKNGEMIHGIFTNLSKKQGKICIYATHNPEFRDRSDQILHLQEGMLASIQ